MGNSSAITCTVGRHEAWLFSGVSSIKFKNMTLHAGLQFLKIHTLLHISTYAYMLFDLEKTT